MPMLHIAPGHVLIQISPCSFNDIRGFRTAWTTKLHRAETKLAKVAIGGVGALTLNSLLLASNRFFRAPDFIAGL